MADLISLWKQAKEAQLFCRTSRYPGTGVLESPARRLSVEHGLGDLPEIDGFSDKREGGSLERCPAA